MEIQMICKILPPLNRRRICFRRRLKRHIVIGFSSQFFSKYRWAAKRKKTLSVQQIWPPGFSRISTNWHKWLENNMKVRSKYQPQLRLQSKKYSAYFKIFPSNRKELTIFLNLNFRNKIKISRQIKHNCKSKVSNSLLNNLQWHRVYWHVWVSLKTSLIYSWLWITNKTAALKTTRMKYFQLWLQPMQIRFYIRWFLRIRVRFMRVAAISNSQFRTRSKKCWAILKMEAKEKQIKIKVASRLIRSR